MAEGDADGAPAPVTRYRLASSDPDEAVEHMRAAYVGFDLDGEPDADFEFSLDGVSTGPVEVSSVRYLVPRLRILSQPSDRLLIPCAVGGSRISYEHRGERIPADVALAPSTPYHNVVENYLRFRVVTLDPGEVERVAREHTGVETLSLDYHGLAPRTPALGRYWARLTAHLQRDVLAHDELLGEPLLAGQLLDQLAGAVLAVFPNSIHTLDPAPGRDTGGPAVVRRAVEFVEAHAHEPITVTGLATAAGVGVRGLQHAFARHRGVTPVAYLRRVRLERAHADLVAADPTAGDTVAAIAARWGWGNPGRFAADYRRRFGRPPGTTLRE